MDDWKGFKARPSSLNKYAYIENNPSNMIDPSGKSIGSIFDANTSLVILGILGTYAIYQVTTIYFSSIDRLPVYFETIGYGQRALNSDHPTHDEEDEALDLTGEESCETIKWAIGILQRAIALRRLDLAANPQDANNKIGRGHRQRISILQEKLDFLTGVLTAVCELLN